MLTEEQIQTLYSKFYDNYDIIEEKINQGIFSYEEAINDRNRLFLSSIIKGEIDTSKINKPLAYYSALFDQRFMSNNAISNVSFTDIFNNGNIDLFKEILDNGITYMLINLLREMERQHIQLSLDDFTYAVLINILPRDQVSDDVLNFIKNLNLKERDFLFRFLDSQRNISEFNLEDIFYSFDKLGANLFYLLKEKSKFLIKFPHKLREASDILSQYSNDIIPDLILNEELIGLPEDLIRGKLEVFYNNFQSNKYIQLLGVFGEKFDKFASFFEDFSSLKLIHRHFFLDRDETNLDFFLKSIPVYKQYDISTDFILDILEKSGDAKILLETEIIKQISLYGGNNNSTYPMSIFKEENLSRYNDKKDFYNDVLSEIFNKKAIPVNYNDNISLDDFEYLNKLYIIKYPYLSLLSNETFNQYKSFIFDSEEDQEHKAWLVVIFHKRYPQLIKIENIKYVSTIVSKFSNNAILNINGLDDFLIKYKDILDNGNFSELNSLFYNWPGLYDENFAQLVPNRGDAVILQELSKSKDINEILELYYNHLYLLPYFLSSPWLVGIDPEIIIENFDIKEKSNNYFLYLLKNEYNELKEKIPENILNKIIKKYSMYGVNFIDEKISEPFKDFILQNAQYLSFPFIILELTGSSRFDFDNNESPEEILLKLSGLNKDDRVVKQYGDLLPVILSYVLLLGVNPALIKEVFLKYFFKNIQEETVSESSLSNYLYDLSKLLSIFGKSITSLPIDIGNVIETHQYSNKIPIYSSRNDYKYMAEFILKNDKFLSDKTNYKIIQNWHQIPEEIKSSKDYNLILDSYEQLKREILKKYNPKDFNFAQEAEDYGLSTEEYSEFENLYLSAQDVPLPGWTNIQPVQIYNYVGHFTPRSDTRTMFIGSEEYLTCCQKIGGAAEKSAIHSQTSPFGALFLVENIKTGGILSLSWVWSNGNTVVFDNIETKVMKTGASANDRLADILLKIYQEAGQRMKGIEFNDGKNVVEEVLVGSATYGIDQRYLQELPLKEVEMEKKYPEDVDRIYSDAKSERRKLAKIYERMIKLCNKVDKKASDLSDKLERRLYYAYK